MGMWNFIKGLFKGKEKSVKQVEDVEAKVTYIYPKRLLSEVSPRKPREVSDQAPKMSVREWLKACQEVDQVQRRLMAV
jgi:hypothetical protein